MARGTWPEDVGLWCLQDVIDVAQHCYNHGPTVVKSTLYRAYYVLTMYYPHIEPPSNTWQIAVEKKRLKNGINIGYQNFLAQIV